MNATAAAAATADERPYLCIELIDDEMAEGGFEEVFFGAVFQQRVVHRGRSDLQRHSRNPPSF